MLDDKILTVEEVAEYLRLNKQTVTRMASRGELPGLKIGRHWRFRKSDIDARFNEQVKKQVPTQ
jgi:excisionase family DNA binding protein